MLLPGNVPTQIVNHLMVIKHLVSSLLDAKDTSYDTALPKQSHSLNEIIIIPAKVILFMVQTESKPEHKPPPPEHTSTIRTHNTSQNFPPD